MKTPQPMSWSYIFSTFSLPNKRILGFFYPVNLKVYFLYIDIQNCKYLVNHMPSTNPESKNPILFCNLNLDEQIDVREKK